MNGLWVAVFGLSIAFLLYVYAGYPLLLVLRRALRRRPIIRNTDCLDVSVLIAAYNEEKAIGDRLRNLKAQDYPADRVEVIVASDGSRDKTVEIASSLGVRVLDLPRKGKIPALHQAGVHATGDILVFSDANTEMRPDALRRIVERFADPTVGGVVGNTGYHLEPQTDSSGRGEDLYWNYDSWLKALESEGGSVVSAHGGLYAIRRELYEMPPEAGVTDDFFISTGVVAGGMRLVFEPSALAYEFTVSRADLEFSRRIRLMTRGWRSLYLRRSLMNPWRYGFYAVSLASRKLLRRLAPLALATLLASSLILAPSGVVWTMAAATQVAFYLLAAAGMLTRNLQTGQNKILYVPFFFTMANIASMVALFRFLKGDRIQRWQPQRHAAAIPDGG